MHITETQEKRKIEENSTGLSIVETLKVARSVTEITTKIAEFEYSPREDKVVCISCGETFKYNKEWKQDFSNDKMSTEFSHLKGHLKDHILSQKHQQATITSKNQERIVAKHEAREKCIAERINRLAYFQIKHAVPDVHFTLLIYIAAVNGADVGDLNHSRWFLRQILPEYAHEIQRRLKSHLSTPMDATDDLPPVNVVADKATHQRETRQGSCKT